MKKNYAISLYLFVATAFCYHANAQQIVQLSFYSPLISTFGMQYANDHLIVSQDGLLIFDVSQPDKQPKLVSKTPYPGRIANSISVQGKRAYMAQGSNGIFAVYNISSVKNPVLTGSVDIPSTAFTKGYMAPYDNYMYMASFDSIYVIDISKSISPAFIRTIAVNNAGSTGASGLATDGKALFTRTPFSTEVYAISNPRRPIFVASIPNSHTYSEGLTIDTSRHKIFLPWQSALREYMGFDAYDITNPLSPKFLFADSVARGGGEFGVGAYSYSGQVLFLNAGGDVIAFHAADSLHGVVTSFHGEDVPNSSVSILVKDSVFVNAKRGGFEVLKYTNSPEPFCPASMYLKTHVEDTAAFLRWDKADGAVGYFVRYRAVGAAAWSDNMFTTSRRDTLTGLTRGTQYAWSVKTVCAMSASSYSAWSRSDLFTTPSAKIESLISIASNPVQDVLRVNVKSPEVSQLRITDLEGNELFKLQYLKTDNNLSFAGKRPGIYVLQILNKQKQIIGTAKIIKR